MSSGAKVENAISSLPLDLLTVSDGVPVSDAKPGETPIYRNKAHPNLLVSAIHPELDTLAKVFNNSAKVFADRPCFSYRPYDYATGKSQDHFKHLTYSEVNQRKKALGSGILTILDKNPFKNDKLESHRKITNHARNYTSYNTENYSFVLSIFSSNRLEWLLTDLATSAYSITSTALYDTLGEGVTLHILATTETPIVVCSKDKIDTILRLKRENASELSNLISVVSMDPISHSPEYKAMYVEAEKHGLILHDMHQVEVLGLLNLLDELAPSPKTLFTISFTSGTTGANPKGAIISQQNFASAIAFLASETSQIENGKTFVFLPLTHIYERETLSFAFATGYCLGFPHLSFNKKTDAFVSLVEDCRLFRPHYFSIVPRILTKIESVIKSHLESMDTVNRLAVLKIIDYKLSQQRLRDGSTGANEVMDSFPKYQEIKSLFGFDNLLWTQTASAPINPNTLVFLKASLGVGISQMYGLTEITGAFSKDHIYECNPGSCGSTGVGCEVKLVSRPEMGYLVENDTGELLVRGAAVFHGYFKNEAETREVYDKETGWFRSGDIGRIDPLNGRIYIVDRVKNFFKLAQGEYISPEKVENIYLTNNPIIQQLYVHGDAIRSWLVGVVGVSYDSGLKFLNEECGYNKLELSENELLRELNSVTNKQVFLKKINDNVRKHISGIEKLHNIHIEINPLRLDRDVVTPTFKIKRKVAAKFFSSIFDKLYEFEKSLLGARL